MQKLVPLAVEDDDVVVVVEIVVGPD